MTIDNPLNKKAKSLKKAKQLAADGKFEELLNLSVKLIDENGVDLETNLSVGTLLGQCGLISQAKSCFKANITANHDDFRALANLASLHLDEGKFNLASDAFKKLIKQYPNDPMIRRNYLMSLEYSSIASDRDRLNLALEWGSWSTSRAGGSRERPKLAPLVAAGESKQRQLRIGYVSSDLCQHTVGLLVKDVIKCHNPDLIRIYAYHSGTQIDWVSEEVDLACTKTGGKFYRVENYSDIALANLIRENEIDILIDLSGHTKGSRLTAFSYRPAPVMISWLGYFATTGLSYIDGVFLDRWHAPKGSEKYYVESIVRLKSKFCYQPAPWAPTTLSSLPFLAKNYISFGCFNNTNKLNDKVYDAWVEILAAIPNSKLVLKWRTFNDKNFREKTIRHFVSRGIDSARVQLRGPSSHAELLREYEDIDIALDPFPFSGGLTSFEALWMGVPVITLPQSRTVSRQTSAILNQIDYSEFIADNIKDYVLKAISLAEDFKKLSCIRKSLRDKMRAAPFMNVKGFTNDIESAFINLYQKVESKEHSLSMDAPSSQSTVLHVGPGHRDNGAILPSSLQGKDWKELRLDIDIANEPDFVGSILNMSDIANESVDAVYSAHNIEHVHSHEVSTALNEFWRVLKPSGFLLITCPDLQVVCQLIVEDKLGDVIYNSPAGPITPLDIIYGHGAAIEMGHEYMAHKCGFTLKTLTQNLLAPGFATIATKRRPHYYDLWALATKMPTENSLIEELAAKHFPE